MNLPTARSDIFSLSNQLLERGPQIRSTVRAAAMTAGIAIGGFGLWSFLAPLATGAIAPGMVRVDTNKKTVQHLEGGIIREVLVREGDRVRAGQILVRLDPLAVRADGQVLRNQVLTALAEEARLLAERDEAKEISFPPQVLEQRDQPAVAALIETQLQIFRSQRSALDGDIAVQLKKIEQQNAQITALTQQIASSERQIELFYEELVTAQDLLAKGYEKKPRVLGLQRNVASAESELSSLRGRLDTARQVIAEARAQIEVLRRQRGKAISDDVEKARSKRAEAEQQLQKSTDKLARVDVTAPQDGIVLGMKYFSSGAVVPSGGALLDIIPDNENLVLYVRVNPLDIDVVREGLPAQVRLVAYKQRNTPTLAGRVTQVSADAVIDDKTPNASFYMVRVEVEPSELARVPHVKLYPGMPVEAIILTGERTVVDYLLRPLFDSFAHAFRED